MPAFRLTPSHAARLQKIVRHYRPKMGKSWRLRTPTQLWLKVLSQIVVAGNAAPGYTLERSQTVREKLSYLRLKRMRPGPRRKLVHKVLHAIGTRYVGENARRNKKVDAAMHNFGVLVLSGGPRRFFKEVSTMKPTKAKIDFLSKKLKFYKKKGSRDSLIELRLASDCMALDQRLKKILEGVGARIPGSVDRQYEEIETELIKRVAKPSGLTGGKLDRILFQNYGDIMVRLLCM